MNPNYIVRAVNNAGSNVVLCCQETPEKVREWFERNKENFIKCGWRGFTLHREDEEKLPWPRELRRHGSTITYEAKDEEDLKKQRGTLLKDSLFEVIYPSPEAPKEDWSVWARRKESEPWALVWDNRNRCHFDEEKEARELLKVAREGGSWLCLKLEKNGKTVEEDVVPPPKPIESAHLTSGQTYMDIQKLIDWCQTPDDLERVRKLYFKYTRLVEANQDLKRVQANLQKAHEETKECLREISKNSSFGSASPSS